MFFQSALSAESAEKNGGGFRQLLRFTVGDLQCAIDLSEVERVYLFMELIQVPGRPDYCAGLMNYHGQGIAVIDLGSWLGMGPMRPYSLETPVILCRLGAQRLAFIVSEVTGVERAPVDAIRRLADPGASHSPFRAVASLPDGLVMLLDTAGILEVSGLGEGKEDKVMLQDCMAPAKEDGHVRACA